LRAGDRELVLDPGDLTRIVAVLDWEMATLGDPLMDLGTSLGYWIDPGDKEGFSKDPRFAMMIFGVQILGNQAARAIDQGRIHDLG
jgi:aminoglycoside phosphotransferase (APT) family kinase protein